MVRYLLLISVMANTHLCKGQSFDQTVRYINNVLKNSTYNVNLVESEDFAYDEVRLNGDGLLKIQRYIANKQTGKISFKGQSFESYIKNLEFSNIEKTVIDHRVYLISKRHKLTDIAYIDSDLAISYKSQISFYLMDYASAEKVANALKHLITIANEKAEFITGDF